MRLGALCDRCPLRNAEGPVLPEANPAARYVVVGSYPADQEIAQGRFYVGPAGKEIERTLRMFGVHRRDVHWTNVVLCQPPANDLKRVEAPIEKRNARRKREYERALREWHKARRKAARAGRAYDVDPPHPPAFELTAQECCRPRLAAEIRPFDKFFLLGTRACKALLGPHANVMKVRGGMVDEALRYDAERNVFETVALEDEHAQPPAGFRTVKMMPVFEPAFVLRARRWTKAFQTDVGRGVEWFRGRLRFVEPRVILNPSPAQLEAFLDRPGAVYAYDVETDGIECLSASMRCIAIGSADEVMVVGLRDKDAPPRPHPHSPEEGATQTSLWYGPDELNRVLAAIKRWLTRPDMVKVGHNAGYYDFLNVWTQLGVRPVNTLDTILLHRLVASELPHNLGFVASIYAPAVKSWKADRDGRKIALEAESNEELHRYCGLDVANTMRVLPALLAETQARGQAHLIAKDHAVQRICAYMHRIGMYVDQEKRAEIERDLIGKAIKLRSAIREIVGNPDFNPGSRDQCAALWFDEWKLRPSDQIEPEQLYTASGAYSTADVVVRDLLANADLRDDQRRMLLLRRKYQKTQKLLGTYVAKLRFMHEFVPVDLADDDDDEDSDERAYRKQYGYAKRGIVWPDGRVRAGYNAHVTNVGRLSSSSPFNAQNVPKWLRVMIRAAPGHVLVGADQDQFHIRIFTALWQIRKYMEAFARGADPHAVTADACFPPSNKPPQRFRSAEGFPGGRWDGDFFIPDGTGDWHGDAKSMRNMAKRVQFLSAYAGGVEMMWRLMRSAENKDGDLIYLKMTLAEARMLHDNWLAGVPEVPRGWEQEKRLYDQLGYLADPVDGRRKDFLDGPTKQELANYRTLATEAALMNAAMIKATDAIPFDRWGPGTGLITQTHDAMVFEVPADGVYQDGDTLRATKGTPAWETLNVLREVMNYEHPKLPGVRFTSTPKLAWTWDATG